jgi:Flp pilus assembly protein TadG
VTRTVPADLPPRARWRGDQGSVAAESVVVLPLLFLLLILLGVLVYRTVDARLRLDGAAHQAARAASLAPTPTAAAHAAQTTASHALADAAVCPAPQTTVDTGDFQPGGLVTVTITCHVNLVPAGALGVPSTAVLSATASSPIDRWRSVTTTAAASTTAPHRAIANIGPPA